MADLVQITIVRDGGEAERLGLLPGDLIFEIDGSPVATPEDVSARIAQGAHRLTILRGAQKLSISTTSPRLDATLNIKAFDVDTWRRQHAIKNLLIATTHGIAGRRTIAHVGIVSAQVVAGINLVGDFLVAVRDVAGGRSGTLQNAIANARNQAFHDLRTEAHDAGANAVIGLQMTTDEIGEGAQSIIMLTATGTAVKIE